MCVKFIGRREKRRMFWKKRQKNPKEMQKEMEQIEIALREKWLNSDKLDLAELAVKAQELVKETKEKNTKFEHWREYLRVKCLVDEKVQNVKQNIVTAMALLISSISCFICVLAVVVSLNKELMIKEISVPMLYIISLAILVGTLLIVYDVIKPYFKKYSRERAFYELLLYYADKISK